MDFSGNSTITDEHRFPYSVLSAFKKHKDLIKSCGDVTFDAMDKGIGRPVVIIKGSVSANNFIEFEEMKLIGNYLHFQICLPSDKEVATFHLELVTSDSLQLRLTASTLYDGVTPRFLGRSLRLPLPKRAGWHVIVLDIQQIVSKYCFSNKPQVKVLYVKKIQICSSLLLRDVISSDVLLSSDPKLIPKELSVKQESLVYMDWINLMDECVQSSSSSPMKKTTEKPKRSEEKSDGGMVRVIAATEPRQSPISSERNLFFSSPSVMTNDQSPQPLLRHMLTSHSHSHSEKKDMTTITPRRSSSNGIVSLPTTAVVKHSVPVVDPSDRVLSLHRILGYNGGPCLLLDKGGLLVTTCGPVLILIDLNKHNTSSSSSSSSSTSLTTGFWKFFNDNKDDVMNREEGYRQALLRGHHYSSIGVLEVSEGDRFLCSSETTDNPLLVLWDVKEGKKVVSLRPHRQTLLSMAFSPSCAMIVTVGTDQFHRIQIVVWDIDTLKKEKNVVVIGSSSSSSSSSSSLGLAVARQISDFDISKIRFCPWDDFSLSSCGRENVRFWRIRKGHLPGRPVLLSEYSRGFVFNDISFFQSEKKSLLVSSNKGLLLKIDCDTDQVLCAYQLHHSNITSLCISSSGYVVTGSEDCKLRIWPMDFSDFLLESQHEGIVTNIRVCTDGTKIVIGTSCGTLGVLFVSEHSYCTVLRSHTGGPVVSVAGRGVGSHEFATAGSDRTIRVWDCVSAAQVVEFTSERDDPRCLVYHPNPNRNILVCGFDSGFLRIFDTNKAIAIHEQRSHNDSILQLLFFQPSSSSSLGPLMLASAGQDGIVVIYNCDDENYSVLRSLSISSHPSPPSSHRLFLCVNTDQHLLAIASSSSCASLCVYDTISFSLKLKLAQVPMDNNGDGLSSGVAGLSFNGSNSSLLILTDKHVVNLHIPTTTTVDITSGIGVVDFSISNRSGRNKSSSSSSVSVWEGRISKRLEIGIATSLIRDDDTGILFLAVKPPITNNNNISSNSSPIGGGNIITNNMSSSSSSCHSHSHKQNLTSSSSTSSSSGVIISEKSTSLAIMTTSWKKKKKNNIQMFQEHYSDISGICCACLPCEKIVTIDTNGCVFLWDVQTKNLHKLLQKMETEEEEEETLESNRNTPIVNDNVNDDDDEKQKLEEQEQQQVDQDHFFITTKKQNNKTTNELVHQFEQVASLWSPDPSSSGEEEEEMYSSIRKDLQQQQQQQHIIIDRPMDGNGDDDNLLEYSDMFECPAAAVVNVVVDGNKIRNQQQDEDNEEETITRTTRRRDDEEDLIILNNNNNHPSSSVLMMSHPNAVPPSFCVDKTIMLVSDGKAIVMKHINESKHDHLPFPSSSSLEGGGGDEVLEVKVSPSGLFVVAIISSSSSSSGVEEWFLLVWSRSNDEDWICKGHVSLPSPSSSLSRVSLCWRSDDLLLVVVMMNNQGHDQGLTIAKMNLHHDNNQSFTSDSIVFSTVSMIGSPVVVGKLIDVICCPPPPFHDEDEGFSLFVCCDSVVLLVSSSSSSVSDTIVEVQWCDHPSSSCRLQAMSMTTIVNSSSSSSSGIVLSVLDSKGTVSLTTFPFPLSSSSSSSRRTVCLSIPAANVFGDLVCLSLSRPSSSSSSSHLLLCLGSRQCVIRLFLLSTKDLFKSTFSCNRGVTLLGKTSLCFNPNHIQFLSSSSSSSSSLVVSSSMGDIVFLQLQLQLQHGLCRKVDTNTISCVSVQSSSPSSSLPLVKVCSIASSCLMTLNIRGDLHLLHGITGVKISVSLINTNINMIPTCLESSSSLVMMVGTRCGHLLWIDPITTNNNNNEKKTQSCQWIVRKKRRLSSSSSSCCCYNDSIDSMTEISPKILLVTTTGEKKKMFLIRLLDEEDDDEEEEEVIPIVIPDVVDNDDDNCSNWLVCKCGGDDSLFGLFHVVSGMLCIYKISISFFFLNNNKMKKKKKMDCIPIVRVLLCNGDDQSSSSSSSSSLRSVSSCHLLKVRDTKSEEEEEVLVVAIDHDCLWSESFPLLKTSSSSISRLWMRTKTLVSHTIQTVSYLNNLCVVVSSQDIFLIDLRRLLQNHNNNKINKEHVVYNSIQTICVDNNKCLSSNRLRSDWTGSSVFLLRTNIREVSIVVSRKNRNAIVKIDFGIR